MKIARLLLGVLALSIGITIAKTDLASAVDLTFIQQNPAWRAIPTPPLPPFNGAFHGWVYGPNDTIWTDDGTFHDEAVQAVQSWQTAVPQLSFVHSPTSFYLNFRKDACFPTTVVGCFTMWTFVNDAPRGASYTWTAQIRIPEPERWTPLGRADILRHEIGHWIGLEEQYIEPATCSSVISVMNAPSLPNGESCVGVHAPTSWDIDKATLFWTDAMWAEAWHAYGLYFWSSSLGVFVLVDSTESYSSGIGFHKESIPRITAQVWDVTARGWPRGTWYAAIVKGWSWAFETWSPPVNSSLLFVP